MRGRWLAVSAAALGTAYGLGGRRAGMRGSARTADVTPPPDEGGRSIGATETIGNGAATASAAALAAEVCWTPNPGQPVEVLIPALFAERVKVLRTITNKLASLGADLNEMGAEEAGLAVLDAAGYCLDAIRHLAGTYE